MGGRGSKSSRNSFTRNGGGGAREAGENPTPKAPLPPRDQKSAEELQNEIGDLGKDAESAAMTAAKTNSLSEAKRDLGYAKEYLAEHTAKIAEVQRRFNPTKGLISAMKIENNKAKTWIKRAEAKMAAGKYTKP